jgi:hypothetical protein
MTDLLIYTNDNGSTVTDVSGTNPEIDYEEWLVAKVKELEDDPFQITCLHVWFYDTSGEWYAEVVWHPAHYQEMSFDEINEGHPGHPHNYGDS